MVNASCCSAKLPAQLPAESSPEPSQPPSPCADCKTCASSSASNCWAASRILAGSSVWPIGGSIPGGGPAVARLTPLIRSHHLDVGFQRADAVQALQDGDHVAGRGPDGGESVHQVLDRGPLLQN